MGLVRDKLKRAQLQRLEGSDQRMVLAFEQLFSANFLLPGDVFYSGAMTREQALWANGQAVERALYPDLYAALVPSSPVTITIASPGVITWVAHGLAANTKVQFATSGTLPTGIVAGTVYFVKTVLSVDTFSISATAGGAVINTTGSQTPSHTATAFPHGNGNGTTTFNVPTVASVGTTPGVCRAFVIY